jgi:uncharacterized RDD family membrane protein YckC/predicted  nucleic acid-binding Zn-ribbon protein
MQCPSCGALYKKRSMKCPECGLFRNKSSAKPSQEAQSDQPAKVEETPVTKPRQKARAKPTPSLIEFPGATKASIPQWRKELGERVREVQERRAREATLEAGEKERIHAADGSAKTPPLLELLPQAELPTMNPLVVAALRRIERAHAHSQYSGNAAVAAFVDEEDPEFQKDASPINQAAAPQHPKPENKPQNSAAPPEKLHNLAVVPSPVDNRAEASETPRKPKRLIRDNDPALNYLDSVPTAERLDTCERRSAPLVFRILSGLADLILVCGFCLIPLSLTSFAGLEWYNPRVIGFGLATAMVVGFIYLTISTALSGCTLGMRLFSLRVVDARTGLIPTGGQSAGRALVYVLSIASAGLLLVYMFLDSDRHTAHDRFTRTAVIRV